ncbi:MAG: YidC/Oxa1 family membrane protein insertase [Patescibacteria group bacterium]
MSQLFTTFLVQPLLNLLVFFYNVIPGHDVGIAIILLTLLIKLILYPFSLQSIRSQKALQELQPKIEEVKKQYKDDKEKQAKEMMALYKKEKVNPLSSCLPLLIQLPFLIAVYQVFRTGLDSSSLNLLYPFVQNPGQLNPISFGLIDLAKPNVVLAFLTGLAQFWQSKMLIVKRPPKKMPGAKDEDMMAVMNQQMLYFMPVLTVIIGISLPSGLVLYWFLMTALTAVQQLWMFRKDKNKKSVEVISK